MCEDFLCGFVCSNYFEQDKERWAHYTVGKQHHENREKEKVY